MKSQLTSVFVIFTTSLLLAPTGGQRHDCTSQIFCNGELLHHVQIAEVFPDSKTFVDMSIKPDKNSEEILAAFGALTDEEKKDAAVLRQFVSDYFDDGSEFEEWNATDYTPEPEFLNNIQDKDLRAWAETLNSFWFQLGRKVKQDVRDEPDRYSMIYVDHGVIIPGGRFEEFYYWDSYWIQIGLLHSEMKNTTKGMLQNFLDMVDQLGYVPNGGRIYFTRSQPPLLIPMMKNYYDNTNDIEFLRSSINLLVKEFNFWMDNRSVDVYSGDNGPFKMVRYNTVQDAPRPESYREDYNLADNLTDEDKYQLYHDLHSGAESGWDFSSRWWIKNDTENGDLIHTRTTDIIPVDLNGYMYLNAKILAEFFGVLNDNANETLFNNIAEEFKNAIETVLWNEDEGCWFDYEISSEKQRVAFYQSNIIPLWAGMNDEKFKRVYNYLLKSKSLEFQGGIPTSMQQTGEQWDFPNGWAPLQHFFVDTLSRFPESEEKAFEIARNWLYANYKAYLKAEKMFEKYDVTYQGLPGGGGEYEVVVGFGWTNGVVLDFLARYGDRLTAPSMSGTIQITPFTSTTIALGSFSVLLTSYWG